MTTAEQKYEADLAALGGPTDDDRQAVVTARAEADAERDQQWKREQEFVRSQAEALTAGLARPVGEPERPPGGWDDEAVRILGEQGQEDDPWDPNWRETMPAKIRAAIGELTPPRQITRPFIPTPLDPSNPPPPPVILHRYLYAGGLTALQGEPGAGKSYLALWLAGQIVEAGRPVIYMDEEGGSDLTTERLAALGVDAGAVRARLRYFPFEGRCWDFDDFAALDQLISYLPGCALVVLDSLPDFLAAAGRSEDSAGDVTWFVNTVVRRFLRAGMAVLALDHLRKPDQDTKRRTRSRYARGSGAKLAKADATLLVEVVKQFDANSSGQLAIWKTKDRRGRLDLPWITDDGLSLAIVVADGSVSIDVADNPERVAAPAWNGPTECMAAVLAVATEAAPEELSGRRLVERMRAAGHPFRAITVGEAAERLAIDGVISVRNGPRGSRLFRRQETNTREATLDEVAQ